MVIKVILDIRRANSEGKYPIKLSFANQGKTVLSGLNIFVSESEFDTENQIQIHN